MFSDSKKCKNKVCWPHKVGVVGCMCSCLCMCACVGVLSNSQERVHRLQISAEESQDQLVKQRSEEFFGERDPQET